MLLIREEVWDLNLLWSWNEFSCDFFRVMYFLLKCFISNGISLTSVGIRFYHYEAKGRGVHPLGCASSVVQQEQRILFSLYLLLSLVLSLDHRYWSWCSAVRNQNDSLPSIPELMLEHMCTLLFVLKGWSALAHYLLPEMLSMETVDAVWGLVRFLFRI